MLRRELCERRLAAAAAASAGTKSLDWRAGDSFDGAMERGDACCRLCVSRAVVRTADFMVLLLCFLVRPSVMG